MKQQVLICAIAATLAACTVGTQSPLENVSGPPGAPAPTDPGQELVDTQGCRWWVVVKPSGMEWQKVPGFRADCDGQELAPANTNPLAPPAIEAVEPLPDPLPAAAPGSVVTIGELEKDLPSKSEATQTPEPALEPAPAPAPVAAPEPVFETSEDGRGLYIQAATFSASDNAQDTAEKLRARGLSVLDIDDAKAGLHPLIVGPFANKQARVTALDDLRRNGFPDAYLLLR